MIIVIMNEKALHDITYGLYLIGSRSGERDGACISNTVIQAANSPNRIAVSLNKSNYTTELILDGGQFSVSIAPRLSSLKDSASKAAEMWTSLPAPTT